MNPIEFFLQGHNLKDTQKLEDIFKSSLDISLMQLAIPESVERKKWLKIAEKADQERENLIIKLNRFENAESTWEDEKERNYFKEVLRKELKELGVIDIREREEGIKSDVILEDVQKFYHATDRGFMADGRIFMRREPSDSKGKMLWDKTYHHELGHQRRALSGKFLSQKGKHWHDRPEEQAAIKDALNALAKNYKDADIPFNKIDAYRWVSESPEVEAMENPSRTPFLDRMEYLPTGSEYSEETGYDNPIDYMDALNKSKFDAMNTGLDIKYPKLFEELKFPSHQYIDKQKTFWNLIEDTEWNE